ncbi:hypothetical protein, partial [Pseudomonas viridiflava]|uniref:hypothetical protein n=1 Tax=Pseudomonas viridiflava TaxID=33069 RepID=UPI002ECF3FF2|nr:hypothetical protein [Pseudomonas viridiflava]
TPPFFSFFFWFFFWGGLPGDAVDAVCQENRVIVHRRQAASHGPVFAARHRGILNSPVSAAPFDESER